MMEQNINYQKELEKTIHSLAKEGRIPSLLLHSCCAPCSSYVLEYLSEFFEITVFYYNPNIYPAEEYAKRVAEQERFIETVNWNHPVRFLAGEYVPDDFYRAVKGLEREPEGGARCTVCYRQRLEAAAKLAKEKGFDFFTTTLSISPMKDAGRLNAIGRELSEKYGVAYLFSDFKKRNGYKRSIELSALYGLYRQDYCGCVFSVRKEKSSPEQERSRQYASDTKE